MSNLNETWEVETVKQPRLFINQALLTKLAVHAKKQNIELTELVSKILTGYLSNHENA